MNLRIVIFSMLLCSAGVAHAGNEFSVNCTYSHTLPDDPILYPGQPGAAMMHDFFGNTTTDAYSTYDSLNGNTLTTCDAAADPSAYWVPQLKRTSGIVVPDFQKTYYKNDQPVVAIQPIPPGLEMLAGNHMGTAPNRHINFLCRGGSYTTVAPTYCPVFTDSNGTYSQLDISVHFPDCWDGKTWVPKPMSGISNMAYRNKDGTCPSDFPVKIPELQLNVKYPLGQDPDLSEAQLSLDPIYQNDQWVPQWGSLYTAHGDFVSVWKADIMQYMVDSCMNKGVIAGATCSKSIPTYFSKASADVWIDTANVPHPGEATLVLAPGDTVLINFPAPTGVGDYPYSNAYLQNLAQNITDSNAVMLQIYAATTQWNDTNRLPTAAICTTNRIGGIYLNNVSQVRLNDVSSYVASQIAAGAPQIAICIRNTTAQTVQFSSREGAWAPALYLK
jgi:hypothetical protein